MPEQEFHLQIARELGGIQESLKAIHHQVGGLREQVTIANGRTRKLEDWKLKIKAQTATISALVSGGIAVIVWLASYLK